MASENRTTEDRLNLYRELANEPYKFDFFQALRLIECANFDKDKIGTSQRLADDPVRLNQEPSLAFAPSTISSFVQNNKSVAPKLSVLFFGLFGPNGPLPLHLTEYARERIRNFEDESFSQFANIFHHRLLSLFYRSWSDAQPTTNLDRPKQDNFSLRVSSLLGTGFPVKKELTELDYARLYFAGRYSSQTGNAEGLSAILQEYFNIPVRLEQFIGAWLEIPQQDQMRLGESPATGSLGMTTTLGGRVWEVQSKFRLHFGPLDLNDYRRMLPGKPSLRKLLGLVRGYVGDEIDWDVHLILQGDHVEPVRLGEYGQLGWSSWMKSDYPTRNFDELYLNPMQELL